MAIHLGHAICKDKMMHKHSGFSLIEVMVVMAIIFIIASIAMPPFLRWRTDAQLRGAASNLKGDLEMSVSQIRTYSIYGRSRGNNGLSVVRLGYRRTF